jgi:uncharacterized protein
MTEKKTALITGASSGLGAVFAEKLAAQGCNLALAARRQDRLQALAERLQGQYGVHVEVIQADLAAEAGIARVEASMQTLGALDLLINNAGFGLPDKFLALPAAYHQDMINVHLVATIRLAHAALPPMIERGQGAIINVSSVAGFLQNSNTSYAPTKGYLNAFSLALQEEVKGSGVRIQALCPGFTRTEFHEDPRYGKLKTSLPAIFWMTSEAVVDYSLKGLGKKQVLCVPGRINRLIVFLARTGILGVLRKIGGRYVGV